MLELTNNDFKESVTRAGLACVDFNATWCGPCRSLAPRLETIAGENPDITFFSANVEECVDAAEEHRVMSVPTLLFFRDGEVVPELRIVGVQSNDKIQEKLDILSKKNGIV